MQAASRFARSNDSSRPLLAVYFPLGDPEIVVDLLDVYAENRVDIVELGWPARDPYLAIQWRELCAATLATPFARRGFGSPDAPARRTRF